MMQSSLKCKADPEIIQLFFIIIVDIRFVVIDAGSHKKTGRVAGHGRAIFIKSPSNVD